MTPLQKQKVEILKAARDRIRSGRNFSICGAIKNHAQASMWSGNNVWEPAESLLEYIHKALGVEWYGLKGWIDAYRPDRYSDVDSMTQYRLQWIDWMIFCLENPDLPPPEPKGNP